MPKGIYENLSLAVNADGDGILLDDNGNEVGRVPAEDVKNLMNPPQNRFNSKVVWAALVSNLFLIFTLTGLDKAIGIDMGVAGDVVALVLDSLVIVGILNNPTDKANF